MNNAEYDRYLQERFPTATALGALSTVIVLGLSLLWVLSSGMESSRDKAFRSIHVLQEMASRLSLGLIKRPVPNLAHTASDSTALNTLQRGFGAIRSIGKGTTSDAPAGLGNWDNSCYQNSVIQGLASLRSFPNFLKTIAARTEKRDSINVALLETVGKLNSAENNGRQLWLPQSLKTMSTWQQQDAQEYFSKILDEVDKEAIKSFKSASAARHNLTLDNVQQHMSQEWTQESSRDLQNPLEGLLAQRVACKSCGHSDGISLIPFNCLTVPLGRGQLYDIRDCLDDYTKLEEIDGVQCPKCTLLEFQKKLQNGLSVVTDDDVRTQLRQRLQTVTQCLEDDDLSDNAILKSCQIPKKQWAESTKTKQAVIARAAKSFVFHVNRSMFNEMTGEQLKNLARIQFPLQFNLGDWMLGHIAANAKVDGGSEHWSMNAQEPMGPSQSAGSIIEAASSAKYELRAVVTHYGRHDNGHYVCYRKHPAQSSQFPTVPDEDEIEGVKGHGGDDHNEPWWRLSDEDVSPISEDLVLRQGGVFMLFYERIEEGEVLSDEPASLKPTVAQHAPTTGVNEAARIPLPEADEDLLELADYRSSRPMVTNTVPLPTPPESVAESDIDDLLEEVPTHNQGPAKPIPMRTSNNMIESRGSQDSLLSHRMVSASGLAH